MRFCIVSVVKGTQPIILGKVRKNYLIRCIKIWWLKNLTAISTNKRRERTKHERPLGHWAVFNCTWLLTSFSCHCISAVCLISVQRNMNLQPTVHLYNDYVVSEVGMHDVFRLWHDIDSVLLLERRWMSTDRWCSWLEVVYTEWFSAVNLSRLYIWLSVVLCQQGLHLAWSCMHH